MLAKSSSIMEDFVCNFRNCGKRFSKRSRLEYHKSCHLDAKPFACEYDGCGVTYARRQHLKRHVDKIHSHPEKNFKCSVLNCIATFDTEYALKQHTKRSHPSGKLVHKCGHCEELFEHVWQVQEHEASHTNIKPFRCDSCMICFLTYDLLKKHNRTHNSKNSKRVFKCKDCSEEYDTFALYTTHIKEHSEDKRKCKTCNIVFQRKFHLEQHILIAHTENQVEYKCTVEGCARVYSYKRNLIAHTKSAHEGKSHLCELCGRELSTKQKLTRHIEQHNADSPDKTMKKKVKKSRIKEKLLKQLVGNGNSTLDVDITRKRKPIVKKPHISHILSAKEQFSPQYNQSIISELDSNSSTKENEKELPQVEY